MFKFNLSEVLRDKVTSFEGLVMARTEYATGCIQYGLAKMGLNKDGGIDDWLWFDEIRLTPKGKHLESMKTIGGPQQTAPMM